MARNRFKKIARAVSARLHGEGETVQVKFEPREGALGEFHRSARVVIEGAFSGCCYGAVAERLHKQHNLPICKWVTMRLRLEAADEKG